VHHSHHDLITFDTAVVADVFFNAMSVTPLMIASLQKAQQLGRKPSRPTWRPLPDTAVNTTQAGQPAVPSVVVRKSNGKGYDSVKTFG